MHPATLTNQINARVAFHFGLQTSAYTDVELAPDVAMNIGFDPVSVNYTEV